MTIISISSSGELEYIHVPMSKYLAVIINKRYVIINPQTLEKYRSSRSQIQRYSIEIVDKILRLPLYDKFGRLINYEEGIDIYEYNKSNFPIEDKYGKRIKYL